MDYSGRYIFEKKYWCKISRILYVVMNSYDTKKFFSFNKMVDFLDWGSFMFCLAIECIAVAYNQFLYLCSFERVWDYPYCKNYPDTNTE